LTRPRPSRFTTRCSSRHHREGQCCRFVSLCVSCKLPALLKEFLSLSSQGYIALVGKQILNTCRTTKLPALSREAEELSGVYFSYKTMVSFTHFLLPVFFRISLRSFNLHWLLYGLSDTGPPFRWLNQACCNPNRGMRCKFPTQLLAQSSLHVCPRFSISAILLLRLFPISCLRPPIYRFIPAAIAFIECVRISGVCCSVWLQLVSTQVESQLWSMKEEGVPEFCIHINMNEDRTFETDTRHMGKINDFWNHILESEKCASYKGPFGNSSSSNG
jgi:hypothetical protein